MSWNFNREYSCVRHAERGPGASMIIIIGRYGIWICAASGRRYTTGAEPIVLTVTTGVFVNPGSIASEPVIAAYGSGDITLMIGSQMVELKGIEGSITLNTELQEAYSGTTSMNSAVDGEFPTLPPGAVPYSWEGDVSRIEIQPNWRSL